jgi:hypothetical protein
MTPRLWILSGGVAMSALALVGSVTPLLEARTLERLLLPLGAFGGGLHSFVGGLAGAGAFLVDVRPGLSTWLAAADEVPQELGEFGVLVHGARR